MTYCFICFIPTLETCYNWQLQQNFTRETGGKDVTRHVRDTWSNVVDAEGIIKRRECGSREHRECSQVKREKLLREELIISLMSTAGEKFPKSFILTMTSWRTDQHCRAVWEQEQGRALNHPWVDMGHHHLWCPLLHQTLCSHHTTTSHLQ